MSSAVSVSEKNPDAPLPERTTGLSDEQKKDLLAVAGRRKDDPSMDCLIQEVTQYREKLRLEEIANDDSRTTEHHQPSAKRQDAHFGAGSP